MRVPLVCLLAVAAGVMIGGSTALAGGLAVTVTGAAVAGRRFRATCVLTALAAVCFGYGARAHARAVDPPLVAVLVTALDDRQSAPVQLSGIVHDDAAIEAEGARLTLDVDRIRSVDGAWIEVAGRAQLSVNGGLATALAAAWVRGRRLTAPVLVRRPQVFRNPGTSAESWQRLRRGIDITGAVKSAALIAVTPGSPTSEVAARLRAHVRRAVTRTVGRSSAASAGIVTAILIGDRTGLDDDAVRRLQQAGTYHVIAISGGNIAIVVVCCLVGLRPFVRSARVIAALALAVVWGYGELVGDQASVSRAVMAATVVLGLQVAGWSVRPMQVFVLAALGVALSDPLSVVDVGAWLSFGATLGILLLSGPIVRRLPWHHGRIASWIGGLLAATLAAELALIPIGASVFLRVSVAGLVLNFVAIPAMALTQLAGTLTVLLADVWPRLAMGAGLCAHAGALALLRSADLLDLMPWLSWLTPPVWWGWTAAYYASLGAALKWRSMARMRRSCLAVSVASLLVIVSSPMGSGLVPPPGWLRVAMLDVGQGQAIAVQFPTGQSLLVDAGGSATAFDVGARVVVPALWALGIHRLDWLAVTHGDIDHAGGAASVLRDLQPREVWEGVPVPRDALMQTLRRETQMAGAVWRRVLAGHHLEVGSAAVDVLNPPAPEWERQDARNDDSLVLQLTFGRVSLLLTGDMGQAVEESLTFDRVPRLRVVTAPHHGSRTSSSSALVQGLLPHAVLISAGRGNPFGHPSPEVLTRYRDRGVEVFRTDQEGAISLETDGRLLVVRTHRGRVWRLSYGDLGGGGE